MRALPGRRGVIRPLACRRQLSSDDDRLPFNRGICLPEADDPGYYLVCKSDIDEDHMVVRMVNDAVQESNEIGVALPWPSIEPQLAEVVAQIVSGSTNKCSDAVGTLLGHVVNNMTGLLSAVGYDQKGAAFGDVCWHRLCKWPAWPLEVCPDMPSAERSG